MAIKKKIDVPVITPCHDHEWRTCLQVAREAGQVSYIPLDVAAGLCVLTATAEEFDRRYRPMVNYPAAKAAQLYLGYSQTIGATPEALEHLGRTITITKEEIQMATKKATAKTTAKAAVKKTVAEKVAPAKKSTAKGKTVAAKPAKTAAPVATGAKKETAAQLFQDLIMEGKLTDAQIFAKVQDKFGLDEKKRGYVKWYRSHLAKQGKNPPAEKI